MYSVVFINTTNTTWISAYTMFLPVGGSWHMCVHNFQCILPIYSYTYILLKIHDH